MAEMVRIAEIAKRLRVDLTTVRRLIAKESDACNSLSTAERAIGCFCRERTPRS